MKVKKHPYFLFCILCIGIFLLSSCESNESIEVEYSFATAKDVENGIEDFDKVKLNPNQNLDLGFYKGEVWIKLDIQNKKEPQSLLVLCDDLINQNYRFYKFDNQKNKPIALKQTNLEKQDHRTFNYAKPNFLINLEANEKSSFYITTSSDGRILQATPSLITLYEFESIRQKSLIFDVVFYLTIVLLLSINFFYYRMIRNNIYYFYGAYILSSCLMYLFVEGKLYGLGLTHTLIDHLMFISIRIWIISSILFAFKFLETKATNPKFYKFILSFLIVTLGTTTLYQLLFPSSSISNLHITENILGFVWTIIALTTIVMAFKKRKIKSTYYLISYSIFLFFITLGLVDSHKTLLPGDPFMYFKIGTIFEFIGFTYFIAILIKKKLIVNEDLEKEISENRIAIKSLLNDKSNINKTDLIGVFKLLENSLSNESDWDEFKSRFKELNPKFIDKLLDRNPNLSKSEIRLLTLIKIDYSTKDIANILSIEPDSVKKAKTRLRKKLDISDTTNLTDYLKQF